MTEVEQLRKEVNELRERIARLEATPRSAAYSPAHPLLPPRQPEWVPEVNIQMPMPGRTIC